MKHNKHGNARILIVDDDRNVVDVLMDFVTRLGYRGVPAYGGIEGLSRFREGDFQLVLLDLVMPDMDGMEVLEAIKGINSTTSVIMISGLGTIEKAVDAMKKGAYYFISKPVDLKTLEVVILRAIEWQAMKKQWGIFRGLTLALVISIPLWLILGIMLARLLLSKG